MFGSLGGPEIIVIFVLALLLFGPRKLPDIGRALGRTVAEFRKATQEFRTTLEREVELEKLKEASAGLRSAVQEPMGMLRDTVLAGTVTAQVYGDCAPEPPAASPAGEAGSADASELPRATVPVPFSSDSADADSSSRLFEPPNLTRSESVSDGEPHEKP